MADEDFYSRLVSFSRFAEIAEDRHYAAVPEDWIVIVADVKGSTEAAEQGRYRDVNTIGAASIACCANVLKDLEFPFVFGGDGATLLIPPHLLEPVSRELSALRKLAAEQFGLTLRVGAVPVKEVFSDTFRIEVAKFELIFGKCVAIFRGGGLAEAERRVKEATGRYAIPPAACPEPNLGGLSCRWQDIPNQNGLVLSLMVLATGPEESRVYSEFLAFLDDVFGGDIQVANPVDAANMAYKSVAQCFRDERRYHARLSFSFLYRLTEILVAVLIFKLRIPPGFFDARHYAKMMRRHSDYRKFDDMLRMILDCSASQLEAIQLYLKAAHQRGELYYGMHSSASALMTCYVQDVSDGKHIHFVDGGSGGYTMAAKQLKQQLSGIAIRSLEHCK